MPAVLYANGQIPQHALDPVPAAKDQTAWLLPIPAASFHEVRTECWRRHGWAPVITSAGDGFRSYARQVAVFNERYDPQPNTSIRGPYGDVRTWQGVRYVRMRGPAAAVPGTSNHGKGITVDIANLRYDTPGWGDLAPILVRHGWSNAEGKPIREPWHWNYTRTAYPVDDTNRLPGVDITVPDVRLPDPLEDDLKDDERDWLETVHAILTDTSETGLQHAARLVRELPTRTREAVWRTPVSRRAQDDTTALDEVVQGVTHGQELAAQVAILRRQLDAIEALLIRSTRTGA